MNRQALRSVCSRARPDIQRPNSVPANYFSTGQGLAAEGDAPDGAPKRSLRQRSRAAVSEISSILANRVSTPSSTTQNPRPSPDQAWGGPRKVIDVRSLPRGGLRGRGGFRGRGGISLAPGSRFGTPPRGSAFRGGRWDRGGRGGWGGRRGRGATRGGPGRDGKEGDKEDRVNERKDDFDQMDPAEQEFDDAMRFGTPTLYNPSLTLESLADFMPAAPSTPAGRAATVLQNLSLLGPTDPIGAPLDLHARSYAQDLEAGGVRFFADANAREAAEEFLQQKRRDEAAAAAAKEGEGKKDHAISVNGSEDRIIQPADQMIRQVILDKAIAGQHEAPRYATDPVGLARSWHLRAETYSPNDVDKFEKKLQSLLRKAGKPVAAQVAGQNGRAA